MANVFGDEEVQQPQVNVNEFGDVVVQPESVVVPTESELTGILPPDKLSPLQQSAIEALPFRGAQAAYKLGVKSGQDVLGKNLAGDVLGTIFGGATALGTAFNPIAKGATYYTNIAQALGEQLAGSPALAKKTLLGTREVVPTFQPGTANLGSESANTVANFITELLSQAANDPVNSALILEGLRSPQARQSIKNIPENLSPSSLRPTLPTVITDALRASAEKNVQQALLPTTKETRAITERITPEILERPLETFAFTKEGVKKLTESQVEKAGEAIEAFGELKGEVNPTKISNALEKLKDPFIVEGKSIDPVAIERIQGIQDVFTQYGDSISKEGLRSIRRAFDGQIKASKGFFKDVSQGTILDIKKTAANEIRSIIAEGEPDLVRLNKQFNFWANYNDVITKTVERTKPQQGFMPNLATIAGAVSGTGLPDMAVRAVIFRNIAKATQSPGWKLISAQTKNSIAKALTQTEPLAVVEALKKGDKVLAEQLRVQINQVKNAARKNNIETLTAIAQGVDDESSPLPIDLNQLIESSVENQ